VEALLGGNRGQDEKKASQGPAGRAVAGPGYKIPEAPSMEKLGGKMYDLPILEKPKTAEPDLNLTESKLMPQSEAEKDQASLVGGVYREEKRSPTIVEEKEEGRKACK